MTPKILITGLMLCLFVRNSNLAELAGNLQAEQNSIRVDAVNNEANSNISITSTYLTNTEGHRYGAVFYVHNYNNYDVGIQWWFEGSSNVSFSPERSGKIIVPARTTGVLLTTCMQSDYYKAWDSGTAWYRWSPA